MSALCTGFIGTLISSMTWWNRIHPWFSHGYDTGKTVYQCLTACWVLSLIGSIAMIFFLISFLCLKSICSKITGGKIPLAIVFIAVGVISIGSIISGAYGSSFALKNPGDDDDAKCAKYIVSGYTGAQAWAAKKGLNKLKEFYEWVNDLRKDAMDGNKYTGYLCRDVGASTFTFVFVQMCSIVLFIVILIFSLIC